MRTQLVSALLLLGTLTPGLAAPGVKEFQDGEGKFKFSIDTTLAPELEGWAHKELAPVVRQWYPKICAMLPGDGFKPADNVVIVFRDDMKGVPAFASGNQVSCNKDWYRENLKGEAKGCTVHELVHVVQAYGQAGPEAKENPGWLVEGLADYIRWFLYELESRGAEIPAGHADQVHCNQSYRVSANFLNWALSKDPGPMLAKLNAVAREGKYEQGFWKELTGKTLIELEIGWKEALKGGTVAAASVAANTLTEAESKEGWKLLFNGRDLSGWHNFKVKTIRPGWQVREGTLACVDPHDAGDLCTEDQYGWFELTLEYNIASGGNSGIIFHASDEGEAVWASGPEFQLEDNAKAGDPQRCGWLYALYQPANDPKTNKPLDTTKPAGEWNQVRLVVSPEKCEHYINGTKYFEYQLGSEDFKKRLAASKFASMPLFAKTPMGHICLQGDHGQVAFRNVKVRTLPAK